MTSSPAVMDARIPEPAGLPFVGHLLSIPSGAEALHWLMGQARRLGPIFRLRILDDEMTFVSGPDLVAELSDTSRFRKSVHADLVRLRDIGGDGLFTAFNEEPNWRKAHDILLPAFSMDAMRNYHATMVDVARALINRWDGSAVSHQPVDVAADMTRLTFDTIGLCGFGFDLASFERDEPHPFVEAMTRALLEAQAAAETLPIVRRIQLGRAERYRRDLALMKDVVDDVVQRRIQSGSTDSNDLLGRMLNTPDKITGEPLDPTNIRNQVITFLIAGHETTSGAMSFAMHYLSKHSAVLAKAQAEVDALWGSDDDIEPTFTDVGRLTYVRQILNEALRLWPTAPGYAVEPVEDTVIGGRYAIARGTSLQILIPQLHRSPEWGDSVESFDPERFSPERIEARPVHLFKPFGNGERACIGRQFALHEATLVLAMLIHRYRFNDYANYQLRITQTLTIKPDGLTLQVARRTSAERTVRPERTANQTCRPPRKVMGRPATGSELLLLHGSNLGTSARLARDLAAGADEFGFSTRVAALDDAVNALKPGSTAVIVASSYNGKPTDDAAAFVKWMQRLEPAALDGVSYAVLGVGDRNWAATYQHVPTAIDERLSAAGASRIVDRGAVDVASDFTGEVDRWSSELWAALLHDGQFDTATAFANSTGTFTVEAVAGSVDEDLWRSHGMWPLTVVESRELVDMGHPLGRPKRFLRLALPAGTQYRTGDHLAVLPHNSSQLVNRAAARLNADLDKVVIIRRQGRTLTQLPIDRPVTLREILTNHLELQQPATVAQVAMVAKNCPCPPEQALLEQLAAADPDEFDERVTTARTSILDLLEQYRSVDLTLEQFLGELPNLKPRRYSISSSPLAQPDAVDLMVSVVDAPHRSGDGAFRGTASTYLAGVRPGDTVHARIVPCSEDFRLDPATPAIAISAGTGLAPFRAMVQDRLHTPGSATLICYFGCDHPEVDYLHREELEQAHRQGAVSMRPTYALASKAGQKFVQHRILDERDEIWNLLKAGAAIRLCGDGTRLLPGAEGALKEVFRSCSGTNDDDAARAWLEELRSSGRYVADAWSE